MSVICCGCGTVELADGKPISSSVCFGCMIEAVDDTPIPLADLLDLEPEADQGGEG